MEDFYPLNENEENEFFENMIRMGIIEEHGVDEYGEQTYSFNFVAMKEWLPEMYDEFMSEINGRLMNLYEQGYVAIEYDENLKAHFSATEKGSEYFKDLGV